MNNVMENSDQNLFWGEFEHSIDDKGRVIIPQEFRGSLSDEFVVTRGPDRAIFVFPKPVWDEIEQKLQSQVLHRYTGFLQRMLGGRTFVKFDPQYRLAIPKHLREWAGIDTEALILIGQGPKIEIWTKSVWRKYNDNFTYDAMYNATEAVGLTETVGLAPAMAG
jgi:MraZ protein